MSIVSFSNPIVFGLGNILTPRAMQALNAGGLKGLRAQAVQDATLFAVVMSVFALVVVFAGEPLLHLFFVSLNFSDASQVLYVLIAATFFSAIGMPAANALASLERPNVVVTTGFAAAAATIIFVCALMPLFGLTGVAWGLLIGSAVATIGRWAAFLSICSDEAIPQPAPTRLSQ
jgi:O-antigen/teichoic acid export membrane protein